MDSICLASGVEMPVLGLGTWRLNAGNMREALSAALDLGYTHIDTACVYDNQEAIGAVLAALGAPRTPLFITSKINQPDLARDDLVRECDTALKELRTDYLDQLLIHWPNPEIPIAETLGVMGELVAAGKVRSIGLSNFTMALTEEAVAASPVPVDVNQVEFHPLLNQERLRAHAEARGVVLVAYSPLARGLVFDEPVLQRIAADTGRAAGQVALRWMIQKGMVVIPKAASRDHLAANLAAADFRLSEAAMAAIENIQAWHRCVDPGFMDWDPR